MTLTKVLPQVEAALLELPKGLRDHVQRVRELALELAEPLHVDAAKVDFAAAAHDLARALTPEALLAEARRLGITPDAVEEAAPILLHGPIAAERLRQQLGIDDDEVLEAVRYHTTARAGLGPVGQAVFLADKLERDKVAYRPALAGVRSLAAPSPAKAIAACLTEELASLLRRGMLLHPTAVEARNYYLGLTGPG